MNFGLLFRADLAISFEKFTKCVQNDKIKHRSVQISIMFDSRICGVGGIM